MEHDYSPIPGSPATPPNGINEGTAAIMVLGKVISTLAIWLNVRLCSKGKWQQLQVWLHCNNVIRRSHSLLTPPIQQYHAVMKQNGLTLYIKCCATKDWTRKYWDSKSFYCYRCWAQNNFLIMSEMQKKFTLNMLKYPGNLSKQVVKGP